MNITVKCPCGSKATFKSQHLHQYFCSYFCYESEILELKNSDPKTYQVMRHQTKDLIPFVDSIFLDKKIWKKYQAIGGETANTH